MRHLASSPPVSFPTRSWCRMRKSLSVAAFNGVGARGRLTPAGGAAPGRRSRCSRPGCLRHSGDLPLVKGHTVRGRGGGMWTRGCDSAFLCLYDTRRRLWEFCDFWGVEFFLKKKQPKWRMGIFSPSAGSNTAPC